MDELFKNAQRVLDAQPFNSMLGTKLASFSEGEAVLEMPIREELLQQNGFVHGGVVSSLADTALAFAGGSALGRPGGSPRPASPTPRRAGSRSP
jgi:acyl-coenzyme A thioesterase PaaI-like protein